MDHNMDNSSFLSVCLIGHSFVPRLQRFMQTNSQLGNLKLDSDYFNEFTCARWGLRVAQLPAFVSFPTKPHMCLIQIGENDLLRSDHWYSLLWALFTWRSRYSNHDCWTIIAPPALSFLKGLQCENCRDQYNVPTRRESMFGITGVFGVIWITSATMEFIYYAQNNPFMLWQPLQCTNIGATYAQHYCTSNQNSGQYKFLF